VKVSQNLFRYITLLEGDTTARMRVPSNPNTFITRFQRFSVYKIVKNNVSTLEGTDLSPPSVVVKDFRWDSQLFRLKYKPHLQAFYESHNRNVRDFQALLDDPVRANYSKPVLHFESQPFRETDVWLHSAINFVCEVKSQLLELLLAVREKYVNEKLQPVIGPSNISTSQRIIVIPEYANPSHRQTTPQLFSGNNEWVQTDHNWKPIETTPQSNISSRSCKSLTFLTKDQAIIMAFLDHNQQWERYNLLEGDTFRVQIDPKEGKAVIECVRWGNYCIQKALVLPKAFHQADGEGSLLFLMLHRINSRPDWIGKEVQSHYVPTLTLLQTKADEIIRCRRMWIEYPWRRSVSALTFPESFRRFSHVIPSFRSRGQDKLRMNMLLSDLGPFLRVTVEKLPLKFWFPETCTEFVSPFEAASHHVHYNRTSKLESLLAAHNELIDQLNQVN
jgi:hypothetical protein